ncbi:ABC transporter substrate-binding protein [Desulfoplanes formicivorans]|uniref:ABC transporter substrate-binding protein n=1 Tax=Desulfoplanes formicivorans TaxID=1592317 RepID=A0A194AIE2_9BACT|nr:ABC transporter substrate binding protein [Desulfoplanes formicivorans]GAU08841.1 ABC transporter substrate-binding protein [Desulfoplanes formicivorans]
MKKIYYCLLVCLVLWGIPALAARDDGYNPRPEPGYNGPLFRIAYLEGGPYMDYQKSFRGTIAALADLGWIEPIELPPTSDPNETRALWDYVAEHAKSRYIRFLKDGFYTSGWNAAIRPQTRETLITRMNRDKDIDLVMAMGTWAGQDLANDRHHVPTIVISTSNPLQAGIIKSPQDSGFDHLHAQIDPTRYERQVRLFHDVIGFQRLGLVYENTPAGRGYAAVDDVEKVAREEGFEVVHYEDTFDIDDLDLAYTRLVKAMNALAPKVDAFYITANRGIQESRMDSILAPVFKYKLPTFSQSGSREVELGVLMSISQAGHKYIGAFYASTIGKIINGAVPRYLTQIYEEPPKIALNLETAKRIDYNPPFDILLSADEIYEKIEHVHN